MNIKQRYIGEVKEGKTEAHIQRLKDRIGQDVCLELKSRALIIRTVEVS